MMPARTKNDAFDATTIDLRRMTWTSYTKTFVRQWNYWALVLCMCVCDIGDATEMLALSYVLCLGGQREFASEILCLLVLFFGGMLLGGGVVGVFGDMYGRKKSLLSGLILNGSANTN